MSDVPEEECPTVLVDDNPADADAFARNGDLGPHERVAVAIADLIRNTPQGGKAIGLEGSWGSGKSTVLRLLAKKFESDDNTRLVMFDAWSHEDEPLRRTFLESIIVSLIDAGWVSHSTWTTKLENLAKRRRETVTKITPEPTVLGSFFAGAFIFVPVGTALLSKGLRDGITFEWLGKPDWYFCLGLLFGIAPIWVLAFHFLRSFRIKDAGQAYPNRDTHSEEVAISAKRTDGDHSYWALLLNRAINTTKTDTTELTEPTSIEFDNDFKSLMSEANISNQDGRVIVLLDNLDRVDADTAKSIWSTLQTFIRERDDNECPWYKRLWLIVPYDPKGISKIWNSEDGQESTGTEGVTQSFLDKSFQTRFEVPPPVLSDWQGYLAGLLKIAVPEHEPDIHAICRIFSHCRENNDPPTPRFLKLFVNQIGAIHRQWQDEFPLPHVALYVMLKRQQPNLIDQLRKHELPTPKHVDLIGEGLQQSLAGLSFNVPAARGMELLLGDDIRECLVGPDSEGLIKLKESYQESFWPVLDTVLTNAALADSPVELGFFCTTLRESKILNSASDPIRSAALRAIRSSARKVKKWTPFGRNGAAGIADLLTIQADKEFSMFLIDRLVLQVKKIDHDTENHPDPTSTVKDIATITRAVHHLSHVDAFKAFTLTASPKRWAEACLATESYPDVYESCSALRPKTPFNEIADEIVKRTDAGEFREEDLATIKVTSRAPIRSDWTPVIKQIEARIQSGAAARNEMQSMLQSLVYLSSERGVENAREALERAAASGAICNYFHKWRNDEDQGFKAILVATYIDAFPDLSAPKVLQNSAAGHTLILGAVKDPQAAFAEAFLSFCRDHNLLLQIWEMAEALEEPKELFDYVVRSIADSESPEELFSNNLIIDSWAKIQRILNRGDHSGFRKLVSHFTRHHSLCDTIKASETGFSPEAASFYREIVNGAKGAVPGFVKWSVSGLEKMDKSDWQKDLAGSRFCAAFCIDLFGHQDQPKLSISFVDALLEHAADVLEGRDDPVDWMQKKCLVSRIGGFDLARVAFLTGDTGRFRSFYTT